jgi:L-ascorbate metabolism protein UlaG (beta-lactamase superfamily)
MRLKYFAHAAFQITTDNDKVILIDPFLDENPNSPVKSDEVRADYIILTHGHSDHLGDTFNIAKRNGSLIICVFELAKYLGSKGYKTHGMHLGGSYNFDFGRVKFTIAHHGGGLEGNLYGGPPAGVLIFADGKTLYHTGDTGLFYDMKLIGEMNPIDYMLLPIGDNFTMGIPDAVKAVELTNPKTAIPMHYNTFPIIEADPKEFKSLVEKKSKKCKIMEYGEEISL